MPEILRSLSIAALFALGGMAHAQTTDAPADTPAEVPADQTGGADAAAPSDLNMGSEVGTPEEEAAGTTYVKESHGDWDVRCIRAAEGTKDPCQLYQLLKDDQDNAVAEISMFSLPSGQQAAAGATVITPLETLLTEQLTIAVDGGPAKRYPYTFCTGTGCFARIGLTNGDIAAFRAGAKATVTLVPAAAPDQKVNLSLSLSGFTAGYDAVRRINAAE